MKGVWALLKAPLDPRSRGADGGLERFFDLLLVDVLLIGDLVVPLDVKGFVLMDFDANGLMPSDGNDPISLEAVPLSLRMRRLSCTKKPFGMDLELDSLWGAISRGVGADSMLVGGSDKELLLGSILLS